MQVWVSFSTLVRFVLWLAIAGILAGVLLVDEQAAPEPARRPTGEVSVRAGVPTMPAAPAIW
jgi:hypothetical protein